MDGLFLFYFKELNCYRSTNPIAGFIPVLNTP
jgi:hypothetical protein